MPPIVHSLSPIGKRTATCLRFVSVVMIASAASPLPPVESDAASAGMASLIGPSGSGWPITPVEATTTSFAAIFSACAALLHIAAAISRPSALHVFALPELHKIARARPFCRCSRVTMSGAPFDLVLCVNGRRAAHPVGKDQRKVPFYRGFSGYPRGPRPPKTPCAARRRPPQM